MMDISRWSTVTNHSVPYIMQGICTQHNCLKILCTEVRYCHLSARNVNTEFSLCVCSPVCPSVRQKGKIILNIGTMLGSVNNRKRENHKEGSDFHRSLLSLFTKLKTVRNKGLRNKLTSYS
jgi:hypothetical protein